MLDWPKTLPQILGKGWSKDITVAVANAEPRSAGARYRGRMPTVLPISLVITTEQLATLEVFVKTVTKGVLPFSYTDPYTEQKLTVRFLPSNGEVFKVGYKAPDFWSVSLSVEII